MPDHVIMETSRLAGLKDRFLRYWPQLAIPLVHLEREWLTPEQRLLVIGSGRVPGRFVARQVNTDIRAFPEVGVVADGQSLPFAAGAFDAVVCHQVLEHVPSPDAVVAEIHRVLRPGGLVIVSVPFYFPGHASPYDFRRWTIWGLETEFGAFTPRASGLYLGPMAGLLVHLQEFAGVLVPGFYLSYLVKGLLGVVLLPLRYLDWLLVKLPKAHYLAAAIYLVAQKPAGEGPATAAGVTP